MRSRTHPGHEWKQEGRPFSFSFLSQNVCLSNTAKKKECMLRIKMGTKSRYTIHTKKIRLFVRLLLPADRWKWKDVDVWERRPSFLPCFFFPCMQPVSNNRTCIENDGLSRSLCRATNSKLLLLLGCQTDMEERRISFGIGSKRMGAARLSPCFPNEILSGASEKRRRKEDKADGKKEEEEGLSLMVPATNEVALLFLLVYQKRVWLWQRKQRLLHV